MDLFWTYLKCFAVGGLLCVAGQLLIDYTRLTPARILTIFVVAGVVLGALGLYQPLVDWAGAGATVPLTGFGNALAKGVKRPWRSRACSAPLPAGLPPPREASAPPCFSACSPRSSPVRRIRISFRSRENQKRGTSFRRPSSNHVR